MSYTIFSLIYKIYLHVLNLSEVGVLGSEQESPCFIQLGFHPERLVVQQGELGLQTFVLQGLLHNLLWNIPQVHLKKRAWKASQVCYHTTLAQSIRF